MMRIALHLSHVENPYILHISYSLLYPPYVPYCNECSRFQFLVHYPYKASVYSPIGQIEAPAQHTFLRVLVNGDAPTPLGILACCF